MAFERAENVVMHHVAADCTMYQHGKLGGIVECRHGLKLQDIVEKNETEEGRKRKALHDNWTIHLADVSGAVSRTGGRPCRSRRWSPAFLPGASGLLAHTRCSP